MFSTAKYSYITASLTFSSIYHNQKAILVSEIQVNEVVYVHMHKVTCIQYPVLLKLTTLLTMIDLGMLLIEICCRCRHMFLFVKIKRAHYRGKGTES